MKFSYSSLPDSGIYDAINSGFSHKRIHDSDDIMMTWINGGAINKALKLAGDFDLWRQFSKHAPCYKVNTITGYFRRHENGLTNRLPDEENVFIHKR